VIPSFENGEHYLPRGIHVATLDEVEERFVISAPFPEHRKIVFDTFRLWHAIVSAILPNAKFWVNGGFVTHKSWAAPKDVDVVILVRQDDLNSLTTEQEIRLESMLTRVESDRIQPMSGLVDAFVCSRGDIDKTLYWRESWSILSDENKNPIDGKQKGFLEVR
jgi:hypothetical protein